jgi:hypothetical protein
VRRHEDVPAPLQTTAGAPAAEVQGLLGCAFLQFREQSSHPSADFRVPFKKPPRCRIEHASIEEFEARVEQVEIEIAKASGRLWGLLCGASRRRTTRRGASEV